MTKEMPFYLTTEQVAELLRCSQRTVQKLVERGQLGALRLGPKGLRIPAPALESFILGHTIGAPELPPILRRSPRDIEAMLHGFEARFGMTTPDFLREYQRDEKSEAWTSDHHRWAAIAEMLEAAAAVA